MVARAGQAVDLKTVFKSYGNAFRPRELDDCFDAFTVAAASDHDAVESASCGQRFFYRVESSEPVHSWYAIVPRVILNQEQIPLYVSPHRSRLRTNERVSGHSARNDSFSKRLNSGCDGLVVA